MIALSVSVSLLLVLTPVVVGYGCYRRGLAAGQGNKQGKDEYLTVDCPPNTIGEMEQDRTEDTALTVTNQSNSSCRYESPDFYEQVVGTYTGLQQYENTNGRITMDSAEQEIAALAWSDPADVQDEEYEVARPASYIDVL